MKFTPHKRRMDGCAIMALVGLVWVVMLVVAFKAFAHSVKLEGGGTLTFDPYCCNEDDCEEVPLSAITQRGDGWAVDYISKMTGNAVRGFIKEGSIGHKWSPNHQVFACRYKYNLNPDGSHMARCVYPQKPGL